MAVYELTSPEGVTYEIEGPDGASEDEVLNVLLNSDEYKASLGTGKPGLMGTFNKRLEEAQGQRPGLDDANRLGSAFESYTVGDTSIPNPLRTINDAVDLGARALEYGGAAGETALEYLDKFSDVASPDYIASKIFGTEERPNSRIKLGSMLGALGEAFPLGGAELGMVRPQAPNRWDSQQFETFRQEVDRTFAAPGSTRADIDTITDKYKVARFGPELDTAFETKERGGPIARVGDDKPSEDPEAPVEARQTPAEEQLPLPLEEQQAFRFDAPDSLETALRDEAETFLRNRPEEDIPDVRQRELDLETPQQLRMELEEPVAKPVKVTETEVSISPDVELVNRVVDDNTYLWNNAPKYDVLDTFEGVEDLNPIAIAATRPDGTIIYNAKAIVEEADATKTSVEDVIKAATFHESLGHYGMLERFGDNLDNTLMSLYNDSDSFRTKVQNWIKANPDDYGDDLNPIARAAEEVLAEMSEKGQLSSTTLGRFKAFMAELGRDMGLPLKLTDDEVKNVLRNAHAAVVNGVRSDESFMAQFTNNLPTSTTTRYMKKSSVGPGSKGMLQGRNVDPDKKSPIANYRSNRNLGDIMEEITPTKERQTFEEWTDKANEMKLSTKVAENLALGTEAPELLAAKKFLLESTNRAFDLSAKVANGTATAREVYIFGQELERANRIAQSISDVMSNAGRVLVSGKIEIASDKAKADSIRRMARKISQANLNDPAEVAKLAKELESIDTKMSQLLGKAMDISVNALALPRSIMSSFDLSAPFRQAIFLIGDKHMWKNIPSMFKMFGDDAAFELSMNEIKTRPTYKLMERANLGISGRGKALLDREEAFISNWAEKIPVLGRGIKASERAYIGFLNKVRADVFDDLVRRYDAADIDVAQHPDIGRSIARYVNAATGRGDLGSFSQSAQTLSNVLFSPRLLASRINLLNPVFYAKLDPIVRRKAIKDLVTFGAIATTVLKLAEMAGADVEKDPRSTDFAKVKVGDTRYDILGGFGQYLVLGSRVYTNSKIKANGELVDFSEGGYGKDDWLDVTQDFFVNKLSPVASFVNDWRRGRNAIGEPFDQKDTFLGLGMGPEMPKSITSRFIPLFIQDAAEMVQAEGAKGIPMVMPGLFGVGISNYSVDLGHDAYGRDQNALKDREAPEEDPVILEAERLASSVKNSPLSRAPASVDIDGESFKLEAGERDEWQRIMGELQYQFLQEEMATEEWKAYTDEEKLNVMKDIHRDAFAQVKEMYVTSLEVIE